MSLRRVVSLSLLLAILGMLTSSIVLYIVPQGRVAFWSGWTMWGLSKHQWGAIHTNMGFLMLVAGGFHVYFNWRPLTGYMKTKARAFRVFTPNFNAALAVFALFVVLTLMESPPLTWIQDLRGGLERSAATRLGEPPYGHAEESSLRVFMRNVGLDPEVATTNLTTAGIEGASPESRILDVAVENGLTPQALYEIMQGPRGARSDAPLPVPERMPVGSGRLTLESFCEQYNRDVGEAVRILEAEDLKIDPNISLKDNAINNDLEPLDLLDILREGLAE